MKSFLTALLLLLTGSLASAETTSLFKLLQRAFERHSAAASVSLPRIEGESLADYRTRVLSTLKASPRIQVVTKSSPLAQDLFLRGTDEKGRDCLAMLRRATAFAEGDANTRSVYSIYLIDSSLWGLPLTAREDFPEKNMTLELSPAIGLDGATLMAAKGRTFVSDFFHFKVDVVLTTSLDGRLLQTAYREQHQAPAPGPRTWIGGVWEGLKQTSPNYKVKYNTVTSQAQCRF